MASDRVLMKDGLGPTAVDRLATALAAADPGFDRAAFGRRARRGLDSLELKERVGHLIAVMDRYLPNRFADAVKVVAKAADHFPPSDPDDALAGFAAWPLVDWVPTRGLDSPARSMAALRRMTGVFSAEFAVRPFLLADPDGTVARLASWTDDRSEHVRRLVSEGSRPRLPWGVRLPMFVDDPAPVLALLERLKDDTSGYVRRSVANNLNDIAKDHPDLAAATAARWMKNATTERRRLVTHGLRTLVKNGHPGALQTLGFTTRPKVVSTLELAPRTISIGETLELTATVTSRSRRVQTLVVDYAVHHVRAGGRVTAKVFKLKTLDLSPGERIELKKKHSFAPRTVRRYYAGTHLVELLISGCSREKREFELTE